MSNRPRPKIRTRTRRPRGNGQAVVRAVRDWLDAGQLESALGYLVHEASDDQRAEITERSLGITESVAATYGITDDMLKFAISDRITAAVTVDTMDAEFVMPGEAPEIGAALDKTLTAINRDLSQRKAGIR